MDLVIYKDRIDGSVSVCTPSLEKGQSIEEFMDRYIKLDADYYKAIRLTDLPTNRKFFSSWLYNEQNPEDPIDINVEKAHETWKEVWRSLRKPVLEALDVQFMIALENGDMESVKNIGQKKKELRDVTKLELPGREVGESVSDFSDKIMAIRPEILDWSSYQKL